MQPLAKVLSIVMDPNELEKPQDRCPECGEVFQYKTNPEFEPDLSKSFPQSMLSRLAWKPIEHQKCEAKQADKKRLEAAYRKRQELGQMLKRSGFPENVMAKTFESFIIDEESKREIELVKKWRSTDRFGFWLQGPPGSGKSHLMGSFVHRYFAAAEERVPKMVWWSVPFLFDRMTKDFAREDHSEPIFNETLNADVLFLDDLGTQQGKPWETERLFQILDRRLNSELPTFVTTNLSPEELRLMLHERTLSRLLGLCIPVTLKSRDRRRDIFAERTRELQRRQNISN
jgi:DNA replication protein DnaC